MYLPFSYAKKMPYKCTDQGGNTTCWECVEDQSGNTLATARVSAFVLLLFSFGCGPKNAVNPRLDNEMPQKIIWAWERPEDLRFLDPKVYGVAFLAQTIFLEKDGVSPKPRRQPLEVAPGTYLIAVTRIG